MRVLVFRLWCRLRGTPLGNDGLTDAERAELLAEFRRGVGSKDLPPRKPTPTDASDA